MAGIVGGILAALLLATVGESSIQAALEFEESIPGRGDGAAPSVELSRDVQVAGGLTAVVLFGVLNGVLFGTALAAVRHRLTLADDFRRSVALAAAAFVSVGLFPAIKYPANPPGIGDPSTITERTVAYLTLVAAGLALTVACAQMYHRLRSRFGQPSRVLISAVVAIAGFFVLGSLWPANPDQTPEGFSADLLWRFRLESLAALSIQWAALGLGTGWLLSRVADPSR